ncbi:GASA-like protein [Citrus sinensis]|nr:GASA-like protein [Citrus sinensis]
MASRLFLLAAIVLFCIALFSASAWNSLVRFLINILLTLHADTQRGQEVKGANRRLLTSVDCVGLCRVRCSLHSRPNVCTRACGTCCARCNCVPPGTSGNREMCGRCYTDMTTHGNKTKCP